MLNQLCALNFGKLEGFVTVTQIHEFLVLAFWNKAVLFKIQKNYIVCVSFLWLDHRVLWEMSLFI